MARQRGLLYGRVQLFLKRSLSLILLALLGLVIPLSLRWLQPASAQQPSLGSQNLAIHHSSHNLTSPSIANGELSTENDLLQQGVAAYQRGEFQKAIEHWTQAEEGFKNQNLDRALILNYLSLAYQQLGNLSNAKDYLKQSIDLVGDQPEINESKDQTTVRAKIFNTQGRLELLEGKPEAALETWKKAEVIYKQLDDLEAVTGIQINQAQALQSLGQYRQALKSLEQIENNFKEQDFLANEISFSIKAKQILSIANILQAVGDLENSWCTLQFGLSKFNSSSHQTLASDFRLSFGNTARKLAFKLKEQLTPEYKQRYYATQKIPSNDKFIDCKNKTKAVNVTDKELYKQAEDLYHQVINDKLTSSVSKLQAQLNYFNLLIENGNNAQIQNYINQYLDQVQQDIIGLSPSRIGVFAKINLSKNLTDAKQKLGNFKNSKITSTKIEQLLKQAVNEARNLKDLKAESYTLGYLGKLYEQNYEWSKAKEVTDHALNIAKSIRNSDITYQWQWQTGRILSNQTNKDTSKAITTYIEAVNTVNSLRPNLAGIDFQLSGSSIQNLLPVNSDARFYFRDNVEPIYRELVDLLLSSGKQKKLYRAIGVMEMLQVAEIENFLGCDLQSSQEINKAKSVEEAEQLVVQRLKTIHEQDPTAAIIYPIILDQKISVILSVPNQELLYHSSLVSKEELEKSLEKMNLVRKGEGENLNNNTLFKDQSNKLYKWLIESFEKDLKISGIKTLVFVLDDKLRNLPMTVLWDGKKYLLFKDYATALIPSLQLVKLESKLTETNTLFAGLSKQSTSEQTKQFASLPQVSKQFDRIKQEFPLSLGFFNEDFTSQRIQDQLQATFFPIVHLATHGQFSSRSEETFVIDWNKRIDVNELRALLQGTESTKAKSIQLLVLSACQTAKGDKRSALGLAGVAVRSGAESTLATLWNLSAEPSIAELFGTFYHSFKDNKHPVSKAKALQEAQKYIFNLYSNKTKDAKSNNDYEPYYWAAYVLVGNWL